MILIRINLCSRMHMMYKKSCPLSICHIPRQVKVMGIVVTQPVCQQPLYCGSDGCNIVMRREHYERTYKNRGGQTP